jgi:hypothetical protein
MLRVARSEEFEVKPMKTNLSLLKNREGRIGYIILWLMGVPASVLFLIFIVRGH